nr:hypothetical protein [Tanacetum cinerariifolium]
MSHQSLHSVRECLRTTQWISDMATNAKAMVLRQDEELAEQLGVCERVGFGDHDAGEWTKDLMLQNRRLWELISAYTQELDDFKTAAE